MHFCEMAISNIYGSTVLFVIYFFVIFKVHRQIFFFGLTSLDVDYTFSVKTTHCWDWCYQACKFSAEKLKSDFLALVVAFSEFS